MTKPTNRDVPEVTGALGYVPIACALHDHLESAATLRRTLRVAYRNESGEVKRVEDRIADVVARGGAEYAVLGGGQEVRLDRLLQVGEVSFAEEGGSC